MRCCYNSHCCSYIFFVCYVFTGNQHAKLNHIVSQIRKNNMLLSFIFIMYTNCVASQRVYERLYMCMKMCGVHCAWLSGTGAMHDRCSPASACDRVHKDAKYILVSTIDNIHLPSPSEVIRQVYVQSLFLPRVRQTAQSLHGVNDHAMHRHWYFFNKSMPLDSS